MPDDVIRVFLGTEPKTEVPARVLEFSIRRHTARPVQVTYMVGPDWEYDPTDIKVGTGFSLRRFLIPERCEYAGRAVYLDADQLVFHDIGELWDAARDADAVAPVVWCTHQPDKWSPTVPVPQSAVMVIDCRRARDSLLFRPADLFAHLKARPGDREAYQRVMHLEPLAGRVGRVFTGWNHLNVYTPKGQAKHTRLLHYTREDQQPWYLPTHPLAGLWEDELKRALVAGAVPRGVFDAACALWSAPRLDWRRTQGLHPHYHPLRGLIPAEPAAAESPNPPPPPVAAGPPPVSLLGPDPIERAAAEAADPECHAGRNPLLPHPPLGPEARARLSALSGGAERAGPAALLVTSFSRAVYEASGRALLASLMSHPVGPGVEVWVYPEGFDLAAADLPPGATQFRLDDSSLLAEFRRGMADVTPAELGGTHDGVCRCPGGPFAAHSKSHTLPCPAYWFCKHATRWAAKAAALDKAFAGLHRARPVGHRGAMPHLVWLDADCLVHRTIAAADVAGWFGGADLFWLKGPRPEPETGVFGFDLGRPLGRAAVMQFTLAYADPAGVRRLPRWDDCHVLRHTIEGREWDPARPAVRDLATTLGPHAGVVGNSPLAAWLTHAKGRHSRELGLFH